MRAVLRRVLWFFLPGWGTAESPRLDQNWRLRAAFDVPHGVGDVFERLDGRERFLGNEIGGLLPLGVVLSRRDDALFVMASRQEARELSCLVGRLDRPLVEGPLLDFAQRRGLGCTVEAKRRLFSIRLTFTVSGPAYKVDEFADQVRYVVKWQNWFTSHGPS